MPDRGSLNAAALLLRQAAFFGAAAGFEHRRSAASVNGVISGWPVVLPHRPNRHRLPLPSGKSDDASSACRNASPSLMEITDAGRRALNDAS
jgi:hypothetical protein